MWAARLPTSLPILLPGAQPSLPPGMTWCVMCPGGLLVHSVSLCDPVTQPRAPPLFKRTFRRSVYSVRGRGAIINGHDRFVSHFHRICQSVWKHQTLGCLGWGVCPELCSRTCLPDWLWLRGSSGAGRFCVLSTCLTPGPSQAGVEFKACFVNLQSSPWYGDKRTRLTHQRGSQVSQPARRRAPGSVRT